MLHYQYTNMVIQMVTWNDTQPIFIQIRQRIIDLILSGGVDGENPLPSVRQISAELAVNPLTVSKSYQSLVELGVVEKRRGLGMFLSKDARIILLKHERNKFLNEDWPRIHSQIKSLDLDLKDLLQSASKKTSKNGKETK